MQQTVCQTLQKSPNKHRKEGKKEGRDDKALCLYACILEISVAIAFVESYYCCISKKM